ncbi:hypothetical protein IAR55_007185 [Kwoniella newhampshirensis]|uniref:Beta-lactamase-related domain-containing protein n=1 Tax=Kwoniella newhampshirensis TaxID=1651941 RepID=A0AAW0YDC0_9TREE
MTRTPTLAPDGSDRITQILEEAAQELPGCGLAIATVDGLLYEEYKGKRDVLDDASPAVDENTIMWFASTTKLLTSVAVLQLVQNGTISLDTPVSRYLPELSTPLRVFKRLDDDGRPVYDSTHTEITIAMMLNQTAGFGAEFKEKVVAWKSSLPDDAPGKGFVNSSKKSNLVNTPIVEEPGKVYQYGNGCEPTSSDHVESVMPLRWYNEEKQVFEELTTQSPGLTLPRRKMDIEYPVGGGGIYSTCSDYIKLLRHILTIYVSPDRLETPKILSDELVRTLFLPTLPPSAREGLTAMVGEMFDAKEVGELDWSTGLCLYLKEGRRGGWGRHKGSGGWLGAGGTEYWMDPEAKIAVSAAVFGSS